MTDRRETSRGRNRPRPSQPRKPKARTERDEWSAGERIAKYLARAGVASRREVEAMIERGEVQVNGKVLRTPAFKVTGREDIRVSGKRVQGKAPVRVWRYHKPAGLITSTHDPEGRRTIFDELSKALPRTMTIGRLDLTTEGLLLLTNDGEFARAMELPKTGLKRVYRARAHGQVTQALLDTLKDGITIDDGTRFSAINAILDRETGTNNWITVELTEGKNREVRKALEHLGLKVNRLIRTEYGPFALGDLHPGAVDEIPPNLVYSSLHGIIPDNCLPVPRSPRSATRPTHARTRLHRPKR